MVTAPPSEPLPDAGEPHPHDVQFYEDPGYLAEVVARWVLEGRRAGRPAVVVATPERRWELCQRLSDKGLDVAAETLAGDLVLLDARETLASFMSGGLPDWERFRAAFGAALEPLASRARGPGRDGRIQAYGEMVDLLVEEGNPQAALLLEQHWNDLAREYPFALLCAYSLGNFHTEADVQAFREVCAAHTSVTPTETWPQAATEADRLREVSLLQQRARALETEIALRKRVEGELLEALRLRDDFLSAAGHELRTPLTALQLHIHAMESLARRNDVPRLLEKAGRASRQTARLASLVDQLLDVSRLRSGRLPLDLERCDLAEVVRAAVDDAREAVDQAGCDVRLLADTCVEGEWDRGRLGQVLANLISNAAKYGAGRPVELWVKAAGNRARVSVRDHGIGISLRDQARIFDRFERAAPVANFAGLGLGLWISRQVVEAHGGTIHVSSEPGNGATFTVELPLTPANPT